MGNPTETVLTSVCAYGHRNPDPSRILAVRRANRKRSIMSCPSSDTERVIRGNFLEPPLRHTNSDGCKVCGSYSRESNFGCGGVQPSELFSATFQFGTDPSRGVGTSLQVVGWRCFGVAHPEARQTSHSSAFYQEVAGAHSQTNSQVWIFPLIDVGGVANVIRSPWTLMRRTRSVFAQFCKDEISTGWIT